MNVISILKMKFQTKFRNETFRFIKVSCSNHFRSLWKNTISKPSPLSKASSRRKKKGIREKKSHQPLPSLPPQLVLIKSPFCGVHSIKTKRGRRKKGSKKKKGRPIKRIGRNESRERAER